jgi:hypothetical protein
MKNLGTIQPIIVLMALVAIILVATGGIAQAETPLLQNYQVLEVQPFEVPLNVPAPDTAGRDLAYEIIYEITRYSDKFNLFDMVILEGAQEVPAGKKVLLVKGTITAYSNKGTCAATFQFVDKASGQLLPVQETEAKGFTFRVANYIARVIYNYKVGGK